VSFKTIGCRLNQAETARMAAQFTAAGYKVVPFPEQCDVCVIHTCTVTSRADKDGVRLARVAKRSNPNMVVVVAGCSAEVSPERVKKESLADFVVGQRDKFNLPDILSRGPAQSRPKPAARAATCVPIFTNTRALVKVQDGCDFHCAYCIVPTARGEPSSRSFPEIVDEVEALADRGYVEVVLTGANLGRYESGGKTLPDLIARVEKLPGILRIRLSSIEISTVERDLIDYMAGSAKLCRCLHLPLQSGDDRILASMGRKYDTARFRSTVDYALSRIPLLGLGTDIIVGFPGEDENSFQQTVRLVDEIQFSNVHAFSYSKRPGTRAAKMSGQVSKKEKKRRVQEIIGLAEKKRIAFADRFIGRQVSVLIESGADHTAGWTSEYVAARLESRSCKRNEVVTFVPHLNDGGILI
jgi:threonylcarbamoyladenosine tRNA methylthiotransferase MtaB